jgi:hypothetical protein
MVVGIIILAMAVCVIAGIGLWLFQHFGKPRPVVVTNWTDFFGFKGRKIKDVVNQLGLPTEVVKIPPPYEREGTQYRWDYADPEHVIFMFERFGRVHRVNTTKKDEWPGWRGHAAK